MITANGLGIAGGGVLKAQSLKLAQWYINAQMFDLVLQPRFWQYLVMGSSFL